MAAVSVTTLARRSKKHRHAARVHGLSGDSGYAAAKNLDARWPDAEWKRHDYDRHPGAGRTGQRVQSELVGFRAGLWAVAVDRQECRDDQRRPTEWTTGYGDDRR